MSDRPDVAVIMANYNGARFIADAIKSVTHQTLTSWELIIVDDASSDDSVAVAEQAAAGDPRIKIVAQKINRGPAAARNRALELVAARWIAIVDSDDLIPPERLQCLLRRAQITGAAIIADNLMEFSATARPRAFLPAKLSEETSWIALDAFIRSNCLYSRTPPLGYLKPMIRMDVIKELGLRYDETLRIGEDYYFLVHLMAHGYRLLLEPASSYFYRKHDKSISHRLRTTDIVALISAEESFAPRDNPFSPRVQAALKRRRRSLRSLLAYDDVINAIRFGEFAVAARRIARRPHIWPMLSQPVTARLRRLGRRIKMLAAPPHETTLETPSIETSTARTSGVPS
jgi:succinoglycan biosynthesis protein ExoO